MDDFDDDDHLNYALVRQHLEEVVLAQQEAFEKLQSSSVASEDSVPWSQYASVVSQLEAEKQAHAAAKMKLMQVQDELEFALGEIEILRKQIEREKAQFEQTFGALKGHQSLQKNDAASTAAGCPDTTALLPGIRRQTSQHSSHHTESIPRGVGTGSEQYAAQNQLSDRQVSVEDQLSELHIQMQRQMYIARLLETKDSARRGPSDSGNADRRTLERKDCKSAASSVDCSRISAVKSSLTCKSNSSSSQLLGQKSCNRIVRSNLSDRPK